MIHTPGLNAKEMEDEEEEETDEIGAGNFMCMKEHMTTVLYES